jgi:Rho termination factor, N-terminal domain
MNKSELESKSLAELHGLAAEAGVERYRMLTREELISALGGGGGGGSERTREPRQRSQSGGGGQGRGGGGQGRGGGGQGRGGGRQSGGGGREGRPRRDRPQRGDRQRRPRQGREDTPQSPAPAAGGGEEKPKRRRRRRFGRRGGKTVRVQDILLPAAPGGQVLVYAESRAGCTALLRELAAELSGGKGADPVAVLVDPSPEELAEWKREAPKAEIVSAGQERHAQDALAQAARRAESGEAVIVLIDSLSRLAEEFGGSKTAKEMFDAGRSAGQASGSLTIVAALERSG